MGARSINGYIGSSMNSDLAPGGSATFVVSSDTGTVGNATVTGATLYLSSIKTYASTFYLNVSFGGTTLANTSGHSANSSSHAETVALTNLSSYLLNSAASSLVLTVVKTSGSGNKINFREGCTFSLTINYTENTSGGGDSGGSSGGSTGGTVDAIAQNLRLSATKSYGEPVTLTWEYPDNSYRIQTMLLRTEYSSNSSTGWKQVAETKNLSIEARVFDSSGSIIPYHYAWEVNPPTAVGAFHRFRIYTHWGTGSGHSVYSPTLQYVRPTLLAYTDNPIIPGETPVKAVHMLELQTNINRMRAAEKLSNYAFTSIGAGYTKLADWSKHIAELRAAVDGITTSHEAWISFDVNAPRADVIEQLRRVVAKL